MNSETELTVGLSLFDTTLGTLVYFAGNGLMHLSGDDSVR